jgi:hypothetical protein
MAGLAISITPQTSGNLFLNAGFTVSNSTAGDGCVVILAFGTGTAPSHNATATGTAVGGNTSGTSATASANVPLPSSGYVTGLVVGTAYWIDAQYTAATGGTCTIQGFNLQALEQ